MAHKERPGTDEALRTTQIDSSALLILCMCRMCIAASASPHSGLREKQDIKMATINFHCAYPIFHHGILFGS